MGITVEQNNGLEEITNRICTNGQTWRQVSIVQPSSATQIGGVFLYDDG